MPRRRHLSPGEQLLGAQAAADRLRVHRSTLHLAVRQGILVPDARTAGGHVRFRRETLDAYCARFGMGGSATGESAGAAPMRALAELARVLVATESLETIGEAAVAGVRRVLPGIDACSVSVVRPEPGDPHALLPFALFGFPEQVLANYRRLRRTFRFATTTAMRTLEPEICEDAAARQLYTGTQRIARMWQLGAYALFPIMATGEPLGLLLCVSHTPRRFSASERAFLQAVADQLALAIRQPTMHQPCPPVGAAEALLRAALDIRTQVAAGANVRSGAAAEGLVDLYRRLSGARSVCTAGFDVDLHTDEPRLLALIQRARTQDGSLSERWGVGQVAHTALATSLPLRAGRHGAVAAIWQGEVARTAGDAALLSSFAAAYLLAVGSSAG